MMHIDAHHHLWRFDPQEFEWLQGPLKQLRRDFLIPELLTATTEARIEGTVAVQARQTLAETDWLLELASQNSTIRGVVGWLPLRAANFSNLLDCYRQNRALKALRHVVQSESDDFLQDSAFNAGIARLQGSGLVYDILIYERQLQQTLRFVDRHPNQMFVLDHLAKPLIRTNTLQPWKKLIHQIAQRPNVVCKISGMVTEADPEAWTPAQLHPFFLEAVEAFSPARLMVGSDWPVLLAGVGYRQWWELVSNWVQAFSASEQAYIFGGTACRVYRLTPPKRANSAGELETWKQRC